MVGLLQTLLTQPELGEVQQALRSGGRPALSGVSPVHRAMVAAALYSAEARPLLMLCADEREAAQLASDLRALSGENVTLLPGREWQFHPSAAASRQWEYKRLGALYDMAQGHSRLMVATAAALAQRCIPPKVLLASSMTMQVGSRYDLPALTVGLAASGYVRCQQVEGPGQFALRGGILDVFSPAAQQPVRCEFWDDELDAMGVFDTATQRRIRNENTAVLLPAGEVLPHRTAGSAQSAVQALEALARRAEKKETTAPLAQTLRRDIELLQQGMLPAGIDRYMAAVYEEKTTALDYLAADTFVCVCESGRIMEGLKGWLWQLHQDVSAAAESGAMAAPLGELALSESEFSRALERFPVCQMESLPTSRYLLPPTALLQLNLKQLSTYGGSLDAAAADIEHYLQNGWRIVVLCGGEVRVRNMEELLRRRHIDASADTAGQDIPPQGRVTVTVGAVSAGSEWPALQLAILTEGQLQQSVSGVQKRRRTAADTPRQKLQSYTDLTPGDLVVHVHHGIGRFVGMNRMSVDGVQKDYIKLAYAGSDCLYVPATSLDLISKYIGAGDGSGEGETRTKLNKLGGTEWAKTTYRAKAAARDLAQGLIRLYAQRQRLGGFAFSPDSPWQQEFEDAFEYEETDDQLRAVAEIKADMEKPVPMDRLLCGDVGYGKTEVALRAVMKCILDGKQAAILVPTTVLAQQHYATALGRLRSFPVTVEVLSRFRSPGQVRDVLARVKAGRVDLLIGTHKLLQKSVEFKDLGLLVIDEEQRFGVTHKEKLRERAQQVDTLTLSATPIPRTLNMALSGIRDMSSIEQPPRDRQIVQTYVLEHEWPPLLEAIRRELDRGGQVYYLHNRVDNIESTAMRLKEMLGDEVRIATAHGKMGESELSAAMRAMADGEVQILVCTTIIETGIDIPNVNTLIIEDADRMGLAQLHQIRGRIGRSSRRAYAYLTYRPGKVLTEVAAKRLSAIREYVEFGSGFKIAMRDLEIRGAGNLLGPEQSGYMMSVGYDMYLKLLGDAVLEQQGKAAQIRPDCTADITVSAYIPDAYVPAAEQRMDLYRRIAALRTSSDADELRDEIMDRFGTLPAPVEQLLDVALLRADAAAAGVCDITQREGRLVCTLVAQPDVEALAAVCNMAAYRQRLQLSAALPPRLTLYLQPEEDALRAAGTLVNRLQLLQKKDADAPSAKEEM